MPRRGPPIPPHMELLLEALSPTEREGFLESIKDFRAIGIGEHVLYSGLLRHLEFLAWARTYRQLLDEPMPAKEACFVAALRLGLPEDGMDRKYRRERARDREAVPLDTLSSMGGPTAA